MKITRLGYIKFMTLLALLLLMILLCTQIVSIYRTSLTNYLYNADQCLASATDEELGLRMLSLSINWQMPFDFDTATYVKKTIKTNDTVIHVRVNISDPSVESKLRQFMLKDIYPLNPVIVDSIFKKYMIAQSLPVQASYIEYLDLKKDSLMKNSISSRKMKGYITSNIYTLDIQRTIGVRAQISTSVWTILSLTKPSFIALTILIGLTIICIIKLSGDILKFRKQYVRVIRSIANRAEQTLDQAAKGMDEVVNQTKWMLDQTEKGDGYGDLFKQGLIDTNKKVTEIQERLYKSAACEHKVQLFYDNEDGKLEFRETSLELKPLLEKLRTEYESITEKNVVINISVEDDFILYIDESFFTIIMAELMDNAVRFSDYGVNVDISAFRDERNITIVVRDNGWGIHPNELKFVFDAFHQGFLYDSFLPGDMKRFGIGLALIRSLMRSFRGEVSINSEQKKFTEITLKFSLTDDRKIAIRAFKLFYRKMFSLNSFL